MTHTDLNRPQRMYAFLHAISEASRKCGVIIEGAPELEFRDNAQGMYCLNPNQEGPEFGWRQTAQNVPR